MNLKRELFSVIPIITSIVFWPVILLAERNLFICNSYYWFLFLFSKFLFSNSQEAIKRRLFRDLRSYANTISANSHLKLLELGPGDGENFAHYPRNTHITTVEYNPYIQDKFPQLVKKYPTLVLDKCIISNLEDMKSIPSYSFEVVVGTHILCCVSDPVKTVKEIHRILKPKGMFFTQEIVLHQHCDQKKRLYQKWYAPFWSFFTIGCRAGNQEVYKVLRDVGFDVSMIRTFEHPDLPIALNLTHFGMAIKQ